MADAPIAPAPATRRGAEADVYHGVTVPDPYRWLEDGDSPDTTAWVAAHHQRTREALDARPSRGQWHERLSALMALPTTLTIRVAGDRLFTLERPAGADQYVLALRDVHDATAEPTVLVDPAAMAADAAVAVDWFEPSHDGRLVAYGLSEGGTERSVLFVLDVTTGEVLPDRITETRAASVAWMPGGDGFWYTRYPEGDDYHRHVRSHLMGSDPADDPIVKDDFPLPTAWPSVSASRDGRHVLVTATIGWRRDDVHLLDTATGKWTTVIEGVEAHTSLHFDDDDLVGVTTLDAPNGRVVRASLTDPTEWTTVVAERPDTVLGGLAVAGERLLVAAARVAVDHLEWYRHDGSHLADVGLGVAAVVALDADGPHAYVARGTFGAPVDVLRVGDHDLEPAGPQFDANVLPSITVRQVHYPSLDGTSIPMFIAHRADVTPSADTPLILTGYGGFAIAESPVWMPNLAAWCGNGGVFAIAGLRGGYEYGDAWHQAGRREHKQLVYDDFFAAADWLVDEGFTSRERLAVYGGSNGGLLMGVVITQRPDLAPVVWCAVPLLDMIRFPQFLIAKLWTDEYGDPDIAEEFGWLHAYSPYHHVIEGGRYPSVLFTTAEGDTRVDPCHARKMAALLTHASASQDENPILLLQAGRAGHGVGKPASKRVDEGADVLAFFSWQLGLESERS
ncbi:MAG TPA: prolyl oligopeptidase family serine peptidase [Ilumatobacteraceae bacterium]|nr:prolyl oligopeptidase family serine peptidase [Ilumatobacteraceae bacterium]